MTHFCEAYSLRGLVILFTPGRGVLVPVHNDLR